MPKHKAKATHHRHHHHHHAARTANKHAVASRERTRGRFIDAREDGVTAQLNKRQLDEASATATPASYSPAKEDEDQNKDKNANKKTPSPWLNGGGTPGSNTGMGGATAHQ
jgi:hypothetical protein